MSASTIIRVTTKGQPTASFWPSVAQQGPRHEALALAKLLEAIASGTYPGNLEVSESATALAYATCTATLLNAVATNAVTINGAAFTAVASGATGNQWNIGANDTASAVNLATAINGSVTALIAGYVKASSASTVVTISAMVPGVLGNLLVITKTGTPITLAGLTGNSPTNGAGDTLATTVYNLWG